MTIICICDGATERVYIVWNVRTLHLGLIFRRKRKISGSNVHTLSFKSLIIDPSLSGLGRLASGRGPTTAESRYWMTSPHDFWKPRFWFQIAFAELMGDTRGLRILHTPKALLTFNLNETSTRPLFTGS